MNKYFLRPSVREKQLPSSIAPWIDSWEKIGFIKLPLEPPTRIESYHDIIYLFLNHDFLRVIMAILWFIFCGFIESFLAQLSDIRYSHYEHDKVSQTPFFLRVVQEDKYTQRFMHT